MIQNLKYLFVLALLPLFMGCERDLDSENVSWVTTYVRYDLTGGSLVTIPLGTHYAEPGFTAFEGDTDKTAKVVVDGAVDDSNIGLYTITYSAKNSNGYTSSAERKVVIYDPNAPETDLTGEYSSRVLRVDPSAGYSNLNVSIEKLAPGFFRVSDFLGGFYDQGRKGGAAYAMEGYFLLNADNTISYVSSFMEGFGDSLNEITNGKYDPATGVITWDAIYTESNYDFKVTLEKKEI